MIPQAIKSEIDDYVKTGHEHGSFVMACLKNNLLRAVTFADDTNLAAISEIVQYLWNDIPSESWGSAEKVKSWIARITEAERTAESKTAIKEGE